jgi:mannose-1-phosphate guanylyltransferase
MAASDGRSVPRALLLTAGLGTRLRPLTYLRAKAAVPVNGDALVRRIIRWLAYHEVRDLVLNLHHRPSSITAVVGDGAELGVRVRYSWEQPVLGSAGGPRRALSLLIDRQEEARFLIVNGDTITDLNVRELLARHLESGALVTMALIKNPRPDKYGGVDVSPDGWVTGFHGRTSPGSSPKSPAPSPGSFHFIGVQVAEAAVFAGLEAGVPAESVRTLYPHLIADNSRSIAAYVSAATFQDIGAPHDYLDTSLAFAKAEGNRLAAGERCAISDSAELVRTVVWDDVTIGPHARLEDCIIGDGVRIPAAARFARCAIVPAAGRAAATDERIDGDLLIREL